MKLKITDRRAREIAERVPPKRCGQCGQRFDMQACGPTHAVVTACAIEAARADIPDLLSDRAVLLDAEAAARVVAARTAALDAARERTADEAARFDCGLTDDERATAECRRDTDDGTDCLACRAAGYRRTLDADGCICDARGRHRLSCATQGRARLARGRP